MSDWLERLKERLTEDEIKRYLKFLVLPFIVILLIIVIVVADKPEDEENGNGAKNVSETNETMAGAESTAMAEQEPVSYVMSEAEAEITELMEKYFKARRSCDTNALSAVYGGGLTSEMLETERQNMESDVRYYQYFENLTCSTVPGLTEEALVIYARYDVKFRQADTMAPSMSAFYAKKGPDGFWYLAASVSSEELDYMAAVNSSEAVQAVTREVNSALREALESDANLLAAYYELTGKVVEGSTKDQSTAETEEEGEGTGTGESADGEPAG